MVVNRCSELTEVIPSIGARIALQNYFANNDLDKETETSSHISVASVSTPSATPTLTLTITPHDIFNAAMSLDKDENILMNSDIEASIENIEHIESNLKTDTQNIVILNSSDNEPLKKMQRIETVDNMVCYHV